MVAAGVSTKNSLDKEGSICLNGAKLSVPTGFPGWQESFEPALRGAGVHVHAAKHRVGYESRKDQVTNSKRASSSTSM